VSLQVAYLYLFIQSVINSFGLIQLSHIKVMNDREEEKGTAFSCLRLSLGIDRGSEASIP
jgi:hypothetical protein